MAIKALNSSAVGAADVKRLAELLELALTPIQLDEQDSSSLSDFGIHDMRAFDQHTAEIEKNATALIEAANALAALIPDAGLNPHLADLMAKYPWLANVDQFDGVIRERFETTDAGEADANDVLQSAVRLLARVAVTPKLPTSRRGRPSKPGPLQGVIRAVAIFCEEHPSLVFQRTWPTTKSRVENAGRGGAVVPLSEEDLDPPTQTAILIDQVARQLLPDTKRASMRTKLLRFTSQLGEQAPEKAMLRCIAAGADWMWLK